MATLKCLACGHDNNVGDESCSSCSSSLNLKLCSACEAINANSAERCHSCNAQFRSEPEAAPVLEAEFVPPKDFAQEAPLVGRALPAVWRMAAEKARRSPKPAAALWLLPLAAAGIAYYLYAVSEVPRKPEVGQKVVAPKSPEPASKPERAPNELAQPQTAEPKQAQAAVSGKIAPPKVAPAPVAKTSTAAAPAVPAANTAAALPVSEPRPTIPERRRVPVTHTKAVLNGAGGATTVPAAATAAATTTPAAVSAPAETRSQEPGGCDPGVVALGLCKGK